MKSYRTGRLRRGFTLLEVMIVVSIIALVAVIAVPNWLRARKRSQASRILDDLRILDNAMEQYTIENNRVGNESVGPADVVNFLPYIKTGTPLYTNLPYDFFGNPLTLTTLQDGPKLSGTTYNALSDVAPLEFWAPYYP